VSDETPRISVLTPTYGREPFLPLLVECFRSQTCSRLELVVLDDSPAPSAFLASEAERDPRIRYLRAAGQPRATNGAKRGKLLAEARGEYVAYFDDDDYYAPEYLAVMVDALGPHDLVKLAAWFNYWTADGRVYYWDTRHSAPAQFCVPDPPALVNGHSFSHFQRRSFEWGYGFSYVFRREMGLKVGVDDMAIGSDYAFVQRASAAGYRMRAIADETGLALHVLHGKQVSKVFPQYVVPPFVASRAFGAAPERYRQAADAR
jgi:glycosyltransferase involved in cell wall biosynthesis